MTDLFEYIETLKELDCLKDQLRSMELTDRLNKEKASLIEKMNRPVQEIKSLTRLLAECRCDIDLVNLILALDSDEGQQSVNIKVKNKSDLVKLTSNLIKISSITASQGEDGPQIETINSLKRELQGANLLRQEAQNLSNTLKNME